MKCIIPGPNVKILARAVHSLAKLGDELYVESTKDELSFRTVNMSKTAYASFSFTESFFSFYNDGGDKQENGGGVKCQISMRSALTVFRSPITMDKTVESCQIKLQASSDKLLFLLKYKRGVYRTFYIPIIECETLQAFYTKEKTPNNFTVESKVVTTILQNFQNNQEEITWQVLAKKLIIRNYSESEDANSGIRTELSVDSDEFSDFRITKETEVTFCLKELRAVLSFGESLGLPISAFFSTASKPIVFVIKSAPIFEANVVVSTLTGDDLTQESVVEKKREEDIEISEMSSKVQLEVTPVFQEEMEVAANGLKSSKDERKNEFRHIFQRCYQKTPFDVHNIPGYDDVVAPDSDPDSERDE